MNLFDIIVGAYGYTPYFNYEMRGVQPDAPTRMAIRPEWQSPFRFGCFDYICLMLICKGDPVWSPFFLCVGITVGQAPLFTDVENDS